jgi:hypothetical protein
MPWGFFMLCISLIFLIVLLFWQDAIGNAIEEFFSRKGEIEMYQRQIDFLDKELDKLQDTHNADALKIWELQNRVQELEKENHEWVIATAMMNRK